MQVNLQRLDIILDKMVRSMDNSKNEIFEIAEITRTEMENLRTRLKAVQQEAKDTINNVDRLERESRLARLRLMQVSRNFKKYNEEDIRHAYEKAEKIQVELAVLREREKGIRERRDDLMRMLKNLENGVKKADNLANQVNTVLSYLTGTLTDLSMQWEDMQQRQQLGLRVIKAQEEERHRVARDIHDGPAQTLANVVLRIEICEKLLQNDVDSVKKELSDLKETVRSGLVDIRKIIYDLRPMALDDLGLVPTLKRLVIDFVEKYDLSLDFTFHGKERRMHTAVEVAVFRIVQESLNNIIKHAQTNRANIVLEITQDTIQVAIKDEGIGFNVDEVLNEVDSDHFGLLSMRERVELLEGEFKVSSKHNNGSRVFARIPMVNKEVSNQ